MAEKKCADERNKRRPPVEPGRLGQSNHTGGSQHQPATAVAWPFFLPFLATVVVFPQPTTLLVVPQSASKNLTKAF